MALRIDRAGGYQFTGSHHNVEELSRDTTRDLDAYVVREV